jgi:hypothetical protein
LRNSCEDVYGECVRLQNSFEHIKKRGEEQKVQDEAVESSSSSGSSDNEIDASSVVGDIKSDELIEGLYQVEFPEEYLWFKANQDAVQAQA